MNVVEFIKNIEKKYLFYLYNEYKDIFPGCCHEASNLLCGYINYYFDPDFKHKFVSNAPFPHSYVSNGKGIILDFTSWQYLGNIFLDSEDETPSTLLKKAQHCSVFPITQEGKIYVGNYVAEEQLEKMFNIKEVDCYGVYEIEKYPPKLFMKYCTHKRAKCIQENLHLNRIF